MKQIDALEVHATNKSPSAEGRVDVATRAYFSLEEYKAAEKAGQECSTCDRKSRYVSKVIFCKVQVLSVG